MPAGPTGQNGGTWQLRQQAPWQAQEEEEEVTPHTSWQQQNTWQVPWGTWGAWQQEYTFEAPHTRQPRTFQAPQDADWVWPPFVNAQEALLDMECATDVKDKKVKVKPLPDLPDITFHLRRLEKQFGEMRRMLTELVAAQLLAATVASGAAASSDDVYPKKVCNHGAAELFTEELTPSIEYYMAFVE